MFEYFKKIGQKINFKIIGIFIVSVIFLLIVIIIISIISATYNDSFDGSRNLITGKWCDYGFDLSRNVCCDEDDYSCELNIKKMYDKNSQFNYEMPRLINYEPIYYITCNQNYNICSIPEAAGLPNGITCIWQFLAGNGGIADKKVTEVDHTISYNDLYNLNVYCVDMNGKLYYGRENLIRP